jgi:hypothetical protein
VVVWSRIYAAQQLAVQELQGRERERDTATGDYPLQHCCCCCCVIFQAHAQELADLVSELRQQLATAKEELADAIAR